MRKIAIVWMVVTTLAVILLALQCWRLETRVNACAEMCRLNAQGGLALIDEVKALHQEFE